MCDVKAHRLQIYWMYSHFKRLKSIEYKSKDDSKICRAAGPQYSQNNLLLHNISQESKLCQKKNCILLQDAHFDKN